MAEYTCKSERCGRTFGEEEIKLTNDENKCILHCEKINKINNKQVNNAMETLFNDNLKALIKKQENNVVLKDIDFFPNNQGADKVLFECNKIEFDKCIFHHSLNETINETIEFKFKGCIFNNDWKHLYSNKVKYYDCKFENYKLDESIDEIGNLILQKCKFENDFLITSLRGDKKEFKIEKIDLKESTFNKEVKIQFCDIKDVNFYNTTFEDIADFYNTTFEKVNVERTDFEKMVIFTEVIFNCDVNFKYTTFGGNAMFQSTTFKNRINLEKSFIHNEMNFVNANINNVDKKETARIIKHSFDKINNIIEANKYYALEMKKREEELKDNWFEWFVFKIHGIASNHSQDWKLALFWIINIGFIAALFDFYTKNCAINFNFQSLLTVIFLVIVVLLIDFILKCEEKIFSMFLLFGFYLIYRFITADSYLTNFANVINPFSIMTKGETLNLGMLIFKVIIAYLMYQFVVSVRQNTRRK